MVETPPIAVRTVVQGAVLMCVEAEWITFEFLSGCSHGVSKKPLFPFCWDII